MNKITYYCPFCNKQQNYYPNPYNSHVCSNCDRMYDKSILIKKETDINILIEDFTGCHQYLSKDTYDNIMEILKKQKENI